MLKIILSKGLSRPIKEDEKTRELRHHKLLRLHSHADDKLALL